MTNLIQATSPSSRVSAHPQAEPHHQSPLLSAMWKLQPHSNQSTANHFTGICMPSSVSCQLPALLSSPAATHSAMQLHAPSPNVFTGLQCHTHTYGKTLKPQVCTLTTCWPCPCCYLCSPILCVPATARYHYTGP